MGVVAVTGARGYLAGLAAVLILLPLAALAQDWSLRKFDDGSFFSASIAPIDGPEFTLLCGERSPQGLSAAQTGNVESDITPPDAFRLFLSERDIGPPGASAASRRDVLIVAGSTGYRLSGVTWNELYGSWQVDLPANDPAFAAIAGQSRFELRFNGGAHPVSAIGFDAALSRLTGYCRSMFAAIGKPWATAAPAAAAPLSMRQAAEGDILKGCGGPATKAPGAILTGEIDGDGREDVVLDWRAVTCTLGPPRPFCGASMCSADVYLSALYPRKVKPEPLLALGVRLQPLTNGNDAVAVGGSLSSCQRAFGKPACEFLWYWTGADLARLK